VAETGGGRENLRVCRICIEGCPVSCLAGRTEGGGKHEIAHLAEPKACISCGFCEADCPVEAIRLVVPEQPAIEVNRAEAGGTIRESHWTGDCMMQRRKTQKTRSRPESR
jgi:NAD-dependent dihydropyrimidine dehydrogenase PreA subunit